MSIAKNQEGLAKIALEQPNKCQDNLFRYVSNPLWLTTAIDAVLTHEGSRTPGIDGITKAKVNPKKLAAELSKELKAGTYTPQSVIRKYIPKADGGQRPIGIPTMRDRAVQEVLRMVLEPIMESRFLNCSTGFRPMRRTMDAIHLTTYFSNNTSKMWWMVVGNIQGCFDNIPHRKLMGVLKQHIACKKTLRLIEVLLKAGISENGKVSTPNAGVSHGGIVSALFANIYLHELDKYWWEKYGSLTEGQKTYRRTKGFGNVQYVRHADDFLILTNGRKPFADELREEFAEVLADKLGLKLSAEKPHVVHADDGFDFLGFHIKRVHSKQSDKKITLVTPTEHNIQAFKAKVREITDRRTVGDDPVNKLRAINWVVKGWGNYYRHVNSRKTFDTLGWYVHNRIYYWLKYKHANVSAKGSIGKHVINRYLKRHKAWGQKWHVHGTWEYPMWAIKIRRYRINRPKTGNPYLEQADISLSSKAETPLEPNVWIGTSPQRQWAIARMERLESVDYRCERCGSRVNLNAHHAQPRKDGGKHTVENLVILCDTCHIQAHDG
jgi:RNA-directed DNA polymerase